MLIDEHGLNFEPFLPCGLGNVLENALAFGSREWGFVETLGFLAETLAVDSVSAHRFNSFASVMGWMLRGLPDRGYELPKQFSDRRGQTLDLIRIEETSSKRPRGLIIPFNIA